MTGAERILKLPRCLRPRGPGKQLLTTSGSSSPWFIRQLQELQQQQQGRVLCPNLCPNLRGEQKRGGLFPLPLSFSSKGPGKGFRFRLRPCPLLLFSEKVLPLRPSQVSRGLGRICPPLPPQSTLVVVAMGQEVQMVKGEEIIRGGERF